MTAIRPSDDQLSASKTTAVDEPSKVRVVVTSRYAGHTRGNWEVVPKLTASENHKGFRIWCEGKGWIADVSPRDEDGTVGGANARLIADAPMLLQQRDELLAALDICAQRLELYGKSADLERTLIARVRATL